MTDLIQLTKENNVAVITINNPPVNALSPGVPEGISESLDQIAQDASIQAVVLIGGGRTFIAGADIKEFGKMTSGKPRGEGLLPFLLKIENNLKPVIVAIHGTAFGGGLEVAMACHYRVAVATAQVGQPEVKLGIIPGAAGTQRLPRLAGVAKAVEMCTTGNPIKATEALQCGIVDRSSKATSPRRNRLCPRSRRASPHPKLASATKSLATQPTTLRYLPPRARPSQKTARLLAPLAAIAAIEAATKLPFAEGCQVEQELFTECLFSDQSKALIHVFFSEREVAKFPTFPRKLPSSRSNPPRSLAPAPWAAASPWSSPTPAFRSAKRRDQAALDRGLATIQSNYANSVKRGRFTPQVCR